MLKKNIFNLTSKPLFLFLVFFLYSLFMGLIFLEYIIPNVSSLHMQNSTQTPDSTSFNQIAINLAEKIKQKGWVNWELYPAEGASGASSFLAVFYVFFGEIPAFAVFFNAFFHAVSGILVYFITLKTLSDNHFNKNTALIPCTLFVFFPSAMTWVGQIHKESCLSAGIFLALFATINIFSSVESRTEFVKYLFFAIVSLILIASMKPYFLQILFFILLIILFFQFCRILPFSFFKVSALSIFLFSTIFLFTQINRYSESPWLSGESYLSSDLPFSWSKTKYIPQILDRKLNALASTRATLIDFGVANNAKSMIDVDRKPASAIELIRYIPRAFQVSFLTPFPEKWFQTQSLVNFTSSLEMLIFYTAFIGLFFLIFKKNQYIPLLCFCFAFIPLIIYGIASPNTGTLYRIRYPFEMILLLLGVSGWNFMINRIKLKKKIFVNLRNKFKEFVK